MFKLLVFILVLEASRSGALPKHHHQTERSDNSGQQILLPPSIKTIKKDLDFPMFDRLNPAPPPLMYSSDEDAFDVGEEERVNNLSDPSIPIPPTPPVAPEDGNTTVSPSTATTALPSADNSTVLPDIGSQNSSFTTPGIQESNSPNVTMDDKDVVIPTTKQPTPYFDSIIEQAISRLNDTYTLSILLPVTAGFVFASVVIVTVAICSCIRKKCCRRKYRKKVLPESLRNMRQSDREKLLAETSDEEF